MPDELIVVCDANVLYSAPLRDLFMRLALEDLYRARWTNEIHDEWIRNVLKNRKDITRKQLERTRDLMNAHVLDCLVTGYSTLIPSIYLPDPNDRHVIAAARKAKAHLIITFNLSDFPPESLTPFGLEARHPDQFLLDQLTLHPVAVCRALRTQRLSLYRPPVDIDRMLDVLAQQGLPAFVRHLHPLADSL